MGHGDIRPRQKKKKNTNFQFQSHHVNKKSQINERIRTK